MPHQFLSSRVTTRKDFSFHPFSPRACSAAVEAGAHNSFKQRICLQNSSSKAQQWIWRPDISNELFNKSTRQAFVDAFTEGKYYVRFPVATPFVNDYNTTCFCCLPGAAEFVPRDLYSPLNSFPNFLFAANFPVCLFENCSGKFSH